MQKVCIYGIAGTGKTRYLLKQFKDLKDVCYVTFRRNMAEDFVKRCDNNTNGNIVGTIHSVCWKLLRQYEGYSKKDIATAKDYVRFCEIHGIPIKVSELNKEIDDLDEYESFGAKCYAIYNNCINALISFNKWYELPEYALPELGIEERNYVTNVIKGWIEYLEDIGKIDFPMMLYICHKKKLCINSNVLMCDEAHDMTPIQWSLVNMWSKHCEQYYIAFDIMQTIYSFWLSKPEPLIEHWKTADSKIILSPSYRISRKIYDFANNILKRSNQYLPKVQCVGNTNIIRVPPDSFKHIVLEYRPTILCRTKYHLKEVSKVLDMLNVIYTGIFGWTDAMIKTYRAIWCLRNNYKVLSDDLKCLKSVSDNIVKDVKIYTCNKVLEHSVALNYLTEFGKSVIYSSNPFEYTKFGNYNKRKMLNALKNNTKPIVYAKLYTIHGSKGLEWDNVLVIDGITSKTYRHCYKYYEEFRNECRVWYVAMSRAIKNLFVMDSTFFNSKSLNIPFLFN